MKAAADFSDITLEGYRNINTILTIRDRLHCGETLFGDTKADILILGQDPAYFERIRELAETEGMGAYRHEPTSRTNINLENCLSSFVVNRRHNGASPNRDCGVFYANAIWLLKEGDGMAARCPRLKEAHEKCAPVFEATVDGLDQLKLIIALGKDAYRFLLRFDPNLKEEWAEVRDGSELQKSQIFQEIFKKDPWIATTYHPAARRKDGASLLKRDFEMILAGAGLSPEGPRHV